MKIELTAENSAAVAKYAELTGHTPAEFLNRYLSDNMVALFENPRSGELESHLGNLEYRTRVDAERVVAWMEKRVSERAHGAYWFEAEIVEHPENDCFWIEATGGNQPAQDRLWGVRDGATSGQGMPGHVSLKLRSCNTFRGYVAGGPMCIFSPSTTRAAQIPWKLPQSGNRVFPVPLPPQTAIWHPVPGAAAGCRGFPAGRL